MSDIIVNNERDKWLDMEDAELLKMCRCDFYIGSGRGGQKRNKTSNAVRLLHAPTGIIITDCSGRSRESNRHNALKKLRFQLALSVRVDEPVIPENLNLSINNPHYPLLAAALLDFLLVNELQVSSAAIALGITTGTLVKLLSKSPALWQKVNQMREHAGMSKLKK